MAQISYGTITITDTTDINKIENWYLATDLSSGITRSNPASGHGTWTTSVQSMTSSFQYLWNYEKIYGTGLNNTDVLISQTDPVIIGRYGQNGAEGNSITSIDEYYQVTNSTTNPGSSGWQKNTLVTPTSTNKYLWNYQVINYSKTAAEGSYTDARIIGVYGDRGERGTSILKITTAPTSTSGTAGGFTYSYRVSLSTVKTQSGQSEVLKGDIVEYNSNHYQVGYVDSSYVYLGPVTSIKGADGTQYYTFIRYSENANGSGYVSTPTSATKYIGVYSGTESSPPAYNNSGWTWSKYVGDPGQPATQYYAFVKYATDANGSNMQDGPDSTHIYVGTYTGTNSSPAASAYQWSKYVGDPGQPATQYYAFIRYATSSTGANMTDTPTASTTYVGTYAGTKSSPTASDYKWSVYVGTDGVSVTAVKEIYYLTTGNAPTAPSAGTTTTSTSTGTNVWTTVVPTYVPNGKYYTSIQTTLSKGTSPISSTAILNNALTDESYRAWEALSISQNANENAQGAMSQATAANVLAEGLQTKLKYMWTNEVNSTSYPAGSYMASGNSNTFDYENSSTYGFNSFLEHTKLHFRYNAIELDTIGLDGLKLYAPIVSNNLITSSQLGVELTSTALKFYRPGTATVDAQLNSDGLKITNGSIVLGSTSGTAAGNVTLSNIDFSRSINNISRDYLRLAIGSNFGVKNDGTLYASNAEISGKITVGSGSDLSAGLSAYSTTSQMNTAIGTATSDMATQTYVSNNYATQTSLNTEISQRKAQYGTCSTSADTAEKVVTCANFELVSGARIAIKFTTANTTNAPTLNVNSKGAKAIWNANAVASATNPVLWGANATLTFVYDGTQWVLEDKAPSYSIACSTSATTQVKAPAVVGALVINGTRVDVNFSTANTYVSGAVQLNLSSTGAKNIYIDNAVTSTTNTLLWDANTVLSFVRQGAGWYLTSRGDAAKTATKYITYVDTTNGIRIYDGQSANQNVNFAQINSSGLQVYKGGTAATNKVADFGETVQVGKSGTGHTTIASSGMKIYGSNGAVELANIGYGSGNSQSGTADAPYYTLGQRTSSSEVGNYSVAEGYGVIASGFASHAEGGSNIATASTEATAPYSHAEGLRTTASGFASHAEGYQTEASGSPASKASNYRTIAASKHQTAIGRLNIEDSNDAYALIIGNGTETTTSYRLSNALTVDWNGGIQMYLDSNGTSSADATSGTDKDLFNAIRGLEWYSSVIV